VRVRVPPMDDFDSQHQPAYFARPPPRHLFTQRFSNNQWTTASDSSTSTSSTSSFRWQRRVNDPPRVDVEKQKSVQELIASVEKTAETLAKWKATKEAKSRQEGTVKTP
jgi:hypothetical protein